MKSEGYAHGRTGDDRRRRGGATHVVMYSIK